MATFLRPRRLEGNAGRPGAVKRNSGPESHCRKSRQKPSPRWHHYGQPKRTGPRLAEGGAPKRQGQLPGMGETPREVGAQTQCRWVAETGHCEFSDNCWKSHELPRSGQGSEGGQHPGKAYPSDGRTQGPQPGQVEKANLQQGRRREKTGEPGGANGTRAYEGGGKRSNHSRFERRIFAMGEIPPRVPLTWKRPSQMASAAKFRTPAERRRK